MTKQELRPGGRVKYGDRAFEQDAQAAMRGDIVRGLIELITNSDDAYAGLGGVHGKIRIEVEHRLQKSWRVVVRDKAIGMSQSELVKNIVKLGGRTSGSESGLAVRGNLGRGAKDLAAFGPVLFESIHDGKYAALLLHENGKYDDLPKSVRATPSEKSRLGIPRGNGTVVTIEVKGTLPCPRHDTLKRKLSNHYQLRDIMADHSREVLLANLNASSAERLRYQSPSSEVIQSTDLELDGFPRATAHLEVRRLAERCDDAPSDPCRPAGILIKGRHAIYENTLFGFEGNPHAASLHGRLSCDFIDTLANEYEDRKASAQSHPIDNPMPIIRRTRDGLAHEHPLYQELRSAAESVLAEIIREEEEKARRQAAHMENEHTRRDLERLAREAASFMDDELREAEAEELPPGSPGQAVKALQVIPGEAICYLDEDRTLSVVAKRDGLSSDSTATVTVTLEPQGVVELLDGSVTQLRKHKRNEEVLVGQIHIRPLTTDVAILRCECEGRTAEAIVEVRDEKTAPQEPEPPMELEFERDRYRVGWNRTKRIVIRAPKEVVAAGAIMYVSSDDPGIVVLTGQAPLEEDPKADWLTANVKIEGRALGAKATLTAALGDRLATCRAVVSKEGDGPALEFRLVDKDGGKYRALWEEVKDPGSGRIVRVLEIQGRHPALRRYLGEAPDFPGQNSPWSKVMVAEIIAENVCREVARRVDALRPQEERPDSEAFYSEHYTRMLRLLPRFHRLYLSIVPHWDDTSSAQLSEGTTDRLSADKLGQD